MYKNTIDMYFFIIFIMQPKQTTNQSFTVTNNNNFDIHIKSPDGKDIDLPKGGTSDPYSQPGDYQVNDSAAPPVKTYFTIHIDSDDRTLTISPGTLSGKFHVNSALS
ncbi:hypothetical protein BC827DRAFT_1382966 [Russula dissimulans]|nr:hypothetical protein BC827DRAFT_1382966 [Russula dissimulans]